MSSPPPATRRAAVTSGATVTGTGVQGIAVAALHLAWHTLPLGQVDYVNAAWCAYTGLSLARSRGAGWQQALHPDDRKPWEAASAQGAHDGEPYALRYRLARADGVYSWFYGSLEAIHGEDGHLAGWMGTATSTNDGADRGLHETPIRQPEPVAAPVYEPTTFLAAAVHDLKNQLGVSRATAQLLARHLRRSSPVERERVRAGLAQIEHSTSKMQTLVEEFFDLARVQSGQPVEFNRQPTDLVALARGCITEYAPTTTHVLGLFTTVANLVGDWDAARLERVLANLLSNAIKYSAPGSAIQIAITHDASGRRDVAVLTVQDQGVGIPAPDLPHIFTPYYRGSNVVDQVEGTGIGLFGARAIIEQQGGTLEVASIETIGTTVTVRLPCTA